MIAYVMFRPFYLYLVCLAFVLLQGVLAVNVHENSCPFGLYGEKCNKSCKCFSPDETCNSTGHCRNGCRPGFMGNDCSEECQYGWYGKDCKTKCSCARTCKCHEINGDCTTADCLNVAALMEDKGPKWQIIVPIIVFVVIALMGTCLTIFLCRRVKSRSNSDKNAKMSLSEIRRRISSGFTSSSDKTKSKPESGNVNENKATYEVVRERLGAEKKPKGKSTDMGSQESLYENSGYEQVAGKGQVRAVSTAAQDEDIYQHALEMDEFEVEDVEDGYQVSIIVDKLRREHSPDLGQASPPRRAASEGSTNYSNYEVDSKDCSPSNPMSVDYFSLDPKSTDYSLASPQTMDYTSLDPKSMDYSPPLPELTDLSEPGLKPMDSSSSDQISTTPPTLDQTTTAGQTAEQAITTLAESPCSAGFQSPLPSSEEQPSPATTQEKGATISPLNATTPIGSPPRQSSPSKIPRHGYCADQNIPRSQSLSAKSSPVNPPTSPFSQAIDVPALKPKTGSPSHKASSGRSSPAVPSSPVRGSVSKQETPEEREKSRHLPRDRSLSRDRSVSGERAGSRSPIAKVESPRSTGGYPTSSRKQQSATTGEKGATTSPVTTEGGHSEESIEKTDAGQRKALSASPRMRSPGYLSNQTKPTSPDQNLGSDTTTRRSSPSRPTSRLRDFQ